METWRRMILTLAATSLLLLAPTSFAANPASPTPPVPQEKTAKGGQEQHPVIHEAIRQLETVKNELQNQAAHDFKGHREKALEHVDQALQELHLALEVDKH